MSRLWLPGDHDTPHVSLTGTSDSTMPSQADAGLYSLRPRSFLSLRWKLVIPLVVVVLVATMGGAYLIGDAIGRGLDESTLRRAESAAQAVAERMNALEETHIREVTRIAYTDGVADALLAGNVAGLHEMLEPLAASAALDYVLLAGQDGDEVIGLQRVEQADAVDYAVASGTDLTRVIPYATGGPDMARAIRTALVRTSQGYALMTTGPVLQAGQFAGSALVGSRLDHVLAALRGADDAGLAIFSPEGEFLRATWSMTDSLFADMEPAQETLDAVSHAPDAALIRPATLDGEAYQAVYVAFAPGDQVLGVAAVYVPDDGVAASALGRDTAGLVAAGITGLVVLVAFIAAGFTAGGLDRVSQTAFALAAGDVTARTRMRPRDEIGELGTMLDSVADSFQTQAEAWESEIHTQRAERDHLRTVVESIPDGVIVQDTTGRVVLINERGRLLLGGSPQASDTALRELGEIVAEKLGPALAPGVYALGDPTRLPLDGRVLQAQAAALVDEDGSRTGTVIMLRDMSETVAREQVRDDLLDRLSERARPPVATRTDSLTLLAREVVQNTQALQSVISELRDLSTFEPLDLRAGQSPLNARQLLREIAGEWEPLARAAGMRLRVHFGVHDEYVLGNGQRLRWAVGNLIDNAIKYSPEGTPIILGAGIDEDDSDRLRISIHDSGYGIAKTDLPHVFTRFFRGTPRDPQGKPVRKPGTGQGLTIAQRVIEAHGGKITLVSQVGQGTRVTVYLPLTSSVALEMPPSTAGTDALQGLNSAVRPAMPPARSVPELSHGGPYDTVPITPHSDRDRAR